ncbi:diguanylate cyclase domain-containing protein [Actinoplanes sp. NPDC049681]|uniref:GGDEF domain-containing protein n=1 Tax=Actinoplanes sp. NPDC049681 TaxID=3363905 RepID=UPI0037A55F85
MSAVSMLAGSPSASQTSMRRRRRTIDGSAFIARGLGLAGTLTVALVPSADRAAAPLTSDLLAACYAGLAVMTLANILAALAWLRPYGRAYLWYSAGQVMLDTLVCVAMVIEFSAHSQRTTWPLLAVPIVAAAIRHGLVATLGVWAMTSLSYAGEMVFLGDRAGQPQDVAFAIGLHLLIALVAGSQSAAFTRQLADLRAARHALQVQATHDGLTGLANRAHLADFAARHAGGPMAVLLLDLDNFKPVNDALGHAVGDELLRTVAARITGCLPAGALAGRLGGDEFLILLPGCDEQTAEAVTGQVRAALEAPALIGEHDLVIGASIGAAVRQEGSDEDLDALTARADGLMYAAKRRRGTGRPDAPEAAPLVVSG